MTAASRPLPDFARYGGSLALVLGLHAVAILVALNWKSSVAPPPPPPAMMMELAPLPEPQPLPPPPVAQPPQPVEEPPLPKVVEAPKPVIEVPKPKPKPKPQPPKPQPKPEPKPQPPKEAPVEQPAPAAAPAPAKAPAPTPAPPAPPSDAAPSWESQVLGRLGRFKEYPPAARSRGTVGQVMVEFTMDGQGRVLDASIFTSSGSSLLDRAALRAVNRAQPLPIPPANKLSNGTVTLRAPFNFSLTH